jgi:hypothetical protein
VFTKKIKKIKFLRQQKKMLDFPVCLPNPDGLHTRDANRAWKYALRRSRVPRMRVVTFPGLFDVEFGSEFHPIAGVSFLHMEDMLLMQALFAASQFLNARCREQGVPGVCEPNPFVVEQGRPVFGCLYSELSLLGAMLGMIHGWDARREAMLAAYRDFSVDVAEYAPWLRFPDGVYSFWQLIEEAQAKLREAQELAQSFKEARRRFSGREEAMLDS